MRSSLTTPLLLERSICLARYRYELETLRQVPVRLKRVPHLGLPDHEQPLE